MRGMAESTVALVTGAGRGIGREIAQRMAREGYACGLIARTKSQLEETAELIRQQGGRALVTPTDVSKREQVLGAVSALFGFAQMQLLVLIKSPLEVVIFGEDVFVAFFGSAAACIALVRVGAAFGVGVHDWV